MQDTVRAIEGVWFFPVFSLVIFVLFFISVTLWALRIRKKDADDMAKLPLDDGEKPTPIQGDDSHGRV